MKGQSRNSERMGGPLALLLFIVGEILLFAIGIFGGRFGNNFIVLLRMGLCIAQVAAGAVLAWLCWPGHLLNRPQRVRVWSYLMSAFFLAITVYWATRTFAQLQRWQS